MIDKVLVGLLLSRAVVLESGLGHGCVIGLAPSVRAARRHS